MPAPTRWKLPARSSRCQVTGLPFREGDEVVTLIHPAPDGETFLRQDRHRDAPWHPEDHPPAFSQWRSLHHPLPERGRPGGGGSSLPAETLLRRLLDSADPDQDRVRHVLALMLERQKLLRQIGADVMRDGTRVLRYEHRQTGETFPIRDPDIQLAEIGEIQEEVVRLLDSLESTAPSVDGEPVEEPALQQQQPEEQAQDQPGEGAERRERT